MPRAAKGDWPWWRGPHFNGVAESGQKVAVEWSDSRNVAWKAAVPGRGHSTPIVVGTRVFLQTADETERSQSVLCFDRESGKRLWSRELNRGNLQEKINRKNTYATSTIACDRGRLFVLFGNNASVQATALDLDGTIVWSTLAAPFVEKKYPNGYAASPVVYGDTVIVAVDCEGGGTLVALDRNTGKRVWATSRVGKTNYASPIVGHVAGKDQLLLGGLDMVASYNPVNGKPLWDAPAIAMQTSGTPVWEGDMVFAAGGYPSGSTAGIVADGSGRIAWKNTHRIHEQSLLVHKGHVYGVNDTGIALCWETRTGREVWKHRLKAPISASPTLVDETIYLANELGTTWVYRATPEGYQQLAENQLGTIAFASPTICGGQIFLRVADMVDEKRVETLYCIQASSKR
ncbi:MAG: dehydrogenase [Planctomycetaceae bacterium]|nr:dehydrogenase [Planctomycetaceae bacterium]